MPTSGRNNSFDRDWVVTQNRLAKESFEAMPLPTKKNENFRYTEIKKSTLSAFLPLTDEQALNQAKFSVPKEALDFTSGSDAILYFYNGVYLDKVSKPIRSELEVVQPATEANEFESVKSTWGRSAHVDLEVFTKHNQGYWRDGAIVKVASKRKLKVAVVYMYGVIKFGELQTAQATCPRNIYQIEANGDVEILEGHISTNSVGFFGNVYSEIRLEEGAKASVAVGQWLGEDSVFVSQTRVEQKANSNLEFCTLSVSGQPTRNQYHFELNGAGANLLLLNAYAATDRHHIDNSSAIFHRVGETTSEQVSKGLANRKGRVVFSGQLRIEQDAQKSNARQLSQSLLLSSQAEVDAKPQLEVFADDVKAAHGASIGELRPEEVFYLQSRGITKAAARQILGRGYLYEVVGRLTSEFSRKGLEKMIQRLPETYFSEDNEAVSNEA